LALSQGASLGQHHLQYRLGDVADHARQAPAAKEPSGTASCRLPSIVEAPVSLVFEVDTAAYDAFLD